MGKKPMNPILINPKDFTDQYFIEPEFKEKKIVIRAENCHFCGILFTAIFCIAISLSLNAFDPGAWYIIAINIVVVIISIICCYTNIFKK